MTSTIKVLNVANGIIIFSLCVLPMAAELQIYSEKQVCLLSDEKACLTY